MAFGIAILFAFLLGSTVRALVWGVVGALVAGALAWLAGSPDPRGFAQSIGIAGAALGWLVHAVSTVRQIAEYRSGRV